MSKRIRFCALLLCLALLLSAQMLTCLATDTADDGYDTYTITLYAGNHGVFSNGSDTLKIPVKAGERATINSNTVTVDNEKYYVKGFRQSGRDSGVTFQSYTEEVTGDVMYVVAYGIAGDQVPYTVRYVDEDGNSLAESQTFYGNIGDKPVVAFQYIEGYEPQAYNLGKTLSANAAENVFEFRYHPIAVAPEPTPTPTPTPTATPTPTPSAAVTSPTPTPAENGTEETEDEEDAPQLPEVETVPEPENDAENIPDNDTPLTEPEEYVDLDDNETPLAGPGDTPVGSDAEPKGGLSTPAIVGISCGAGLLLVLLALLLLRRKREKRKEN